MGDAVSAVAVACRTISVSATRREHLHVDRGGRQRLRVGLLIRTLRILGILLDRVHPQVILNHLLEIVAAQVGDGQLAEDVVDD